MDKQIENYLHLYLGCEVMTGNGKAVLCGVSHNERDKYFVHLYDLAHGYYILFMNEIKPILRNLSDMTKEEMIEMESIISQYEEDFEITEDMRKAAWAKIRKDGIKGIRFDESNNPLMVFEITRFFLSKHFDLFNLIENNLVLDKSKIK